MAVALSMIIGGYEKIEVVERCMNSVLNHIDKAYVTLTSKDESNLKGLLEARGVVVDEAVFHRELTTEPDWFTENIGFAPLMKKGDKIFEFDKARNHNLSQVSKDYDWVLWLDVDDVFRHAEYIKPLLAQADKEKAEAVYMNYLYQVELENNQVKSVIIEHLRERLVRNNGAYKWVAPIHETLIENYPTKKIPSTDCDVLHLSHDERRFGALYRNISALEMSIVDNKGADPRPVYYLGKAYYDVAKHDNKPEYFERANILFERYLFGTKDLDFNNRSGWSEERAQCWEYISEIRRSKGEYDHAIQACMNALVEDEKFPSIYLSIALNHLLKGNFERSLFWVRLAAKIPEPSTTLVKNPKDMATRTLEILYNANLQLSKLDEAHNAAVQLYDLMPEEPTMQERVKFTQGMKLERELTKAALQLSNYIGRYEDQSKLKPLLTSLPQKIKGNPFIADLIKKVNPPKVWQKDEIAVFCGPGFTPWSPKRLEEPGIAFMGGSEEAVIYACKELAKQGWKVTVYGDPMEDEGSYDGVYYAPYYNFNTADSFNVLVIWRQPKLVDSDFNAKKTFIWCHDIQNPQDYTEERLKKITKVMVLSPWHRKNIHTVPDEKIFITSNGVEL